MRNLILRWGMSVADLISQLADPFDDFARPIFTRTRERLSEKVDRFEEQLVGQFLAPAGVFLYFRTPPNEPWVYGDQALWQGIYTAIFAFKYAVTRDRIDRQFLDTCVAGMRKQYKNGLLVRGSDPGGGDTFMDDVSNDGFTGQLAGLYYAWKHGADPDLVLPLVRNLADELLAYDNCLVNQDHSKTQYGKLINGGLTEPLGATLAMATFRVAQVITQGTRYSDRYGEEFNRLYAKYGALLKFAEFKFLWLTHDYDSHRAALALGILADITVGDAHERCLAGLRRIWKLHRKTRDPWIGFLCASHITLPAAELSECIQRLTEFEVPAKGVCKQTVNSGTEESKQWLQYKIRFLKWGGTMRSSQPLPYWAMPSQDFFPQRHPYSCDGWQGSDSDFLRHNGMDCVGPYWLGRLRGFIKDFD